ncbi:hypothetical protein F5878DRAFT_204820 [Lentinula raphanica]|uniref:C2H2-type domain-containing protein n=1 Tax=Lentinula raphanica TaxID=153919 RepID=A0AA38UDN2_9AGAR|nr:hypothetical protein F5878DRAFT_204820 [Lentinula raphanica]
MPRATSFKFIDQSARECKDCNIVFEYPHELRKHNQEHVHKPQGGYYHCTWPSCSYASQDSSNYKTHYRTHTREKTKACPDCKFTTVSPSSLTRHRKKFHNYIPSAKLVVSYPSVSSVSTFRSVLDFRSCPSSSSIPSSEQVASSNSSFSSSLAETNRSSSASYDLYNPEIPLNLDNLFSESDVFYGLGGTGLDWDAKAPVAPYPRTLSSAMDTEPVLRNIDDTLQLPSDSWADLGLSFGTTSEPQFAYNAPTNLFRNMGDMDLQSNVDDSTYHSQNWDQTQQSLPYNVGLGHTTDFNPPIAGAISPEDLQIFAPQSNNHIEQATTANFPDSASWFDPSMINSTSGSTDTTQVLPLESVFPSTSSFPMDSFFDFDQYNPSFSL